MNGFIGCKVLGILFLCVASVLMRVFIDVHDQPAIVRQYMRYAAQIDSPESLPHHVRRAIQMYVPLSATDSILLTRLL